MNNYTVACFLPLVFTLAACDQGSSSGGTAPVEEAPVVKDMDADGVADGTDNCLLVPNADQANSNGNALGDACDIDTPVVEGQYELTVYHDISSQYLDADSGSCVSASDSPYTIDVLAKGSQVFITEDGGDRQFYGIADASSNVSIFTSPEGQFEAANGYFSEGTRSITFEYTDQQSSADGSVSCAVSAEVEANFNYATSLIAPAEMVPADLDPGDTFYVVFVTSATTVGNLSVDEFNQFVNDAADGSGLKGTDEGDILWKAMLGHDDGTIQGENLFSVGSDRPIYGLGDNRIANSASDLFNGSLLAAIEYDETGASVGDVDVYVGLTGTGSQLIAQGDNTLGGNDSTGDGCALGRSGSASNNAIAFRISGDGNCDSALYPMYAVSPLLEVPAEP